MARTPKPKPELYLFAQPCPDPATRRTADQWKGYTGCVSLQVCQIDRSGGELKPRFFEEYGQDPAGVYRNLTFACTVNSEMMTAAELSYGWRIGFQQFSSEQFPLEPREIARMHRVLPPLVRAYDKECDRVGRPKSFGQFVLWHLGSLNLQGIIKRGERSFEGMFILHSDSLADTIDHLVLRVAEDLARLAGMDSIPAGREAA
jgi:hypothetical protein